MTVGLKISYVLRAKGGRNILVRTNGIPGEAVHDAVRDAVGILAKFAAAKGKPLQDGSGDSPPPFALGRVTVSEGRYAVTYRMVNAILVLVVSDPNENPFTCIRAVDAAAKVLVAACKGPDVTQDRVLRRYLDVYTMLGELLEGGLDSLPPSFVHISATDERLVGMPSSSADAARRFKRLLGPGAKSSALSFDTKATGSEAAAADPAGAAPVAPDTPTRDSGYKRSLAAADPLADVMFEIPMDALPPPPARAMGAPRRPPPPAVPAVVEPPAAFKGALPDEELKKDEVESFGAFAPPELMEAEKAEAAGAETATAEPETEEAAAPAASTAPAVTAEDALDSLMLIEFWRGEARGDRIVKAGIEGAVKRRLAPYGLHTLKFRVLPSETHVVNACMQVANMNKEAAKKETPDGLFTALLSGAPITCSYIKYILPATACRPPLLAEITVAPPARQPRPGTPWECLIIIQYAINPYLPGPLLDVILDVQLPPEICIPVKSSPTAEWSTEQGKLRWEIPRLEPGASGTMRAIMGARQDVQSIRAEEALLQVTTARMTFTGWPGHAPSGLGFQVALPEEGKEMMKGKIRWFGDLTIRPN